MFFGKSRRRKSDYVGTPEYNQFEETDNTQDLLDLQERMRKHGFEGGPGINKDRWTYGDSTFDFDRPGGPSVRVWSIKAEKLNELKALLDQLDAAAANGGVHSVDVDDDGDKDVVIENKDEEKESDLPDTEVSDERCKEIRKKRVDNMKNGWGETDTMKKKKKKTAKADDDKEDSVDVSGIARVLSRGPGSAYEA